MESYFLPSEWLFRLACVVFYASAGLVAYAWLVYPMLLAILFRQRTDIDYSRVDPARGFPFVSIVVAAYNEQDVIESTIQRFFGYTYSGESELLIVSDGSTDRTVEIASRFVSDSVRLFSQSVHAGKGPALARAVPAARGEVLVFTNATSEFAPDTLTELVRPFADEKVGLVTGRVRVKGSSVAGLYRRYEDRVEAIEERGGVISTAHGCVYAMRRSIWCQHDPRLTNDFFHPILVNLKGFDAVVAPKAVCTEVYSPGSEIQFRRQVRMVALAAFAYFKYLPVLVCARKWRSIFVLTSHKLLRWLTAPLLVLLAISTAAIAHYGRYYSVAFGAELFFSLALVVGAIASHLGLHSRLSFIKDFVSLNWAGTLGLWQFWRGNVPTLWETTNIPGSAGTSASHRQIV